MISRLAAFTGPLLIMMIAGSVGFVLGVALSNPH